MKVKLATQLFSNSVAHALEYSNTVLQLEAFRNCEATVQCIRSVNTLFDILNSRNMYQRNYKQPINKNNVETINTFLLESAEYLKSLSFLDGTLLCESNRKMCILGFLFCIESLKYLYKSLIDENQLLLYFPTYKISQDHIELFFGLIRSMGGYNNNPTAKQFKTAFKKMLVHLELRDSFRGNCIPLDTIPILSPCEIINKSCGRERISEEIVNVEDEIDDDVFYEHILNLSMSEFKREVVVYIAGYVVYKLMRVLKCEECIEGLLGDRADFLSSFIDQKNRGQLSYPSEDVIVICMMADKILEKHLSEGNIPKNINKLIGQMLRILVNQNLFKNLNVHFQEQTIFSSHYANLIKLISSTYFNIRIHNHNKNLLDRSRSMRSVYNKLILFKGQ